METFYFGGEKQELFGAYWQPSTSSGAARAVLIANPLGQEYMRTHRALNQLADLLARAGCHVMRFDYYGCGDSLGPGSAVSLSRCGQDLVAARAELTEISGCTRVTLLGVRLGANLALAVNSAIEHAPLVLWDPIVSGRELVESLRAMDRAMHRDMHRFPRPRVPAAAKPERLLGHPYSQILLAELDCLKLGADEIPASAPEIFLLSGAGNRAGAKLEALRRRAGARLREIETEDAYWDDLSTIEVALLPVAAFQTLAGALGR